MREMDLPITEDFEKESKSSIKRGGSTESSKSELTPTQISYVTGASLVKVREFPDPSSNPVGVVQSGSKLTFLKQVGEYSEVEYKGMPRYILSKYLTMTNP